MCAQMIPMIMGNPEARKGISNVVKYLLMFGGLGIGILLFIFFVKKLNPVKAVGDLLKKGAEWTGGLLKKVPEVAGGLLSGAYLKKKLLGKHTEFRPGVGYTDPYGMYGSKTSEEMEEKFYAFEKERTAETMEKLRKGKIKRASYGR